MIAEYIYLGEKLLAMITKPSETEIVSYFHNDHLGTPLILTNDNETIVWKAAYTPFGGAEISVQTVENPFRLPGQYYDQETGLHYNYFRYYDPTTGRYVTPDPIGLQGGINLFAYAAGNPIRYTDAKGLAVPIAVAVGACLANSACASAFAALTVATIYYAEKAINDTLLLLKDKEDWRTKTDADNWPWWQENVGPRERDKCEPKQPDKREECYQKCKHLLPSPSGDLQSSEYRKCYRECMGTL